MPGKCLVKLTPLNGIVSQWQSTTACYADMQDGSGLRQGFCHGFVSLAARTGMTKGAVKGLRSSEGTHRNGAPSQSGHPAGS
ncbi:hypothetical protein AA3271_0905 [Gluconobacter japonicus NBRC 3271]|nr:hypothetical protein AA3271_0905 [Gluconobacter japonicus NBRC 3271]